MKKVAIGCVVLLVLLGAGGVAGSYFVYHKVSSTVSGFAELRRIPELERSVRNQATYVPPASGEPSEAQLQQLLQVQAAVAQRLGDEGQRLERTYHEYLRDEHRATAADLPALVSAYRDLAVGYVRGKRAQIDALNDVGFSLKEYRWVRGQVYAALDMRIVELDLPRLFAEAEKGRVPRLAEGGTMPAGRAPAPSAATRKLVAPYRKRLEQAAPLAFVGL
ncbi:MAG TPA: hypothetical protein VFW66_08045 [Gemmatimonadales bacterium]|nr:hypothetical protein [Gemmatimonadales bacterium]